MVLETGNIIKLTYEKKGLEITFGQRQLALTVGYGVSVIGGDVYGGSSSTDNAIARYNGTTGKIIQNSLVTIDDNGSVNIPTGQFYKINNVALAYSDITNAIALTSLSSSATGLTYTNTTGVFSLTSGYVIPTTTEESNWNTAYGWGNHAGLYLKLDQTTPQSVINGSPIMEGIQFDTTPSTSNLAEGLMRWNNTDGTLDLGMSGGNINMQIGQELFIKVINKTASPILNGKVVYLKGRLGNRPKVELAQSDLASTSCSIGVTTEDITVDAEGYITTFGYVRGIKTDYTGSGVWGTTWAEGDRLFVSKTVAGQLTNVEPTVPHHSDCVATVGIVHSNLGSILVSINKHYTLTELSDVNGTPLNTTGQMAVWNNTAGYFDFNYNITNYQTINSNLTSLSGLTYASTSFVKMTGANTFTLDTNTYLTSLSGAVLTDQSTPQTIGATGARLAMLWATDITCTNAISGSVTGNAGTVTNATFTTALTVNTGTVTLTGNVANTSVLTIGAGAVSVSGSNTGDQTKIQNLIGGNNTTLLGSIPYQSDTDVTTLLSPNTTTTKKFLRQTGTGVNGAIPAWDTVTSTDVGLGNVDNTSDLNKPISTTTQTALNGKKIYHGIVARPVGGSNPLPTTLTNPKFTLQGSLTTVEYYYQGTLVTVNTDKSVILNNNTGGTQTSGTLVIGQHYKITNYISGDDFSNIATTLEGTVNTTGYTFTATGTTPTTWTNGSTVQRVGMPGAYYIYFDQLTGELITSSSTAFSTSSNIIIALVYFNGTNYGLVNDERHNYNRNTDWHNWAHYTVGARYRSGLTLTVNTIAKTFATTAGQLDDEDIEFAISASSSFPTPNAARLLYQTSASLYGFVTTPSVTPGYLGVNGRPYYVNSTGYVLTEMSSAVNRYINVFVYGTTDLHTPIYMFTETVSSTVASNNGYSSTTLARAVPFPNLSGYGLSPELKPLYRLIWRADGELQAIDTAQDDYRTVSSLPQSAGTVSTTASAVTFNAYGNISSTNVQNAIQELDDEKTATATTITIAGTANQITSSAGAQDLSTDRTWTLSLPADVIIPTVLTVPNTGLHLLDTNASHDLIIKPGSNLTADKTLTVTTGDADVNLDLTAVTDEYVLAYDLGTNTWRGVAGGAGGGASTALDNLASVAINTTLVSDTDNTDALGTTAIAWSDLFLGNGAVITFNSAPSTPDITLTHSANTLTFDGGTLALGANSMTMTGSIADTTNRVIKGWFTDVESTNMPTVGGTAILTSLTAPQFTTIELGHASDTTLARSAAGVMTVEGKTVVVNDAGVVSIAGTSSTSGTLKIFEDTDEGTNSVSIKVPVLAGDYTLTLPTTDGDANQFLQTDGSGNLSWAASSGSTGTYAMRTSDFTTTSASYVDVTGITLNVAANKVYQLVVSLRLVGNEGTDAGRCQLVFPSGTTISGVNWYQYANSAGTNLFNWNVNQNASSPVVVGAATYYAQYSTHTYILKTSSTSGTVKLQVQNVDGLDGIITVTNGTFMTLTEVQ